MGDWTGHDEVVIYYKDNAIVFVHPEPEYMHHQNSIHQKCHFENIEVYEVSITYNLKFMGTLKTILFNKPGCIAISQAFNYNLTAHNIIHESFIPAKGISLRVVTPDCLCPNCGYML